MEALGGWDQMVRRGRIVRTFDITNGAARGVTVIPALLNPP
jgi:hypothetical protein